MKKLTNIILTIFAAILIASISPPTHTSAMPMQANVDMMEHTDSTSYQQHCSVSHSGIAAKNEVQQKDIKKRDDKDTEPWPPYYLQFTCPTAQSGFSYKLAYEPGYNSTKVPIYRLYGVIRR